MLEYVKRVLSYPSIFLSGFSVLLYLLIAYGITSQVGVEKAKGTLTYFLGWLMVGHGWNILSFHLNVFLLALVIWLSFMVWAATKWTLTSVLLYELDTFQNLLLFLGVFLFTFILTVAGGFLLMYAGKDLMGGTDNIPLISDVYGNTWVGMVFDTLLAVPGLLFSFLFFMRQVRLYKVGGG